LYQNFFSHNNLSYGNDKNTKLNQSYKAGEKSEKTDNPSVSLNVMNTDHREKIKSRFATQRNNSGNTGKSTAKNTGNNILKNKNNKVGPSFNANNPIPSNPLSKTVHKTSSVAINIPNSPSSSQAPTTLIKNNSSSTGNNNPADTIEAKDENVNANSNALKNKQIPSTTKNKSVNRAELIKRDNNFSPYVKTEGDSNTCNTITNTYSNTPFNETLRSLNSSITTRDKERDFSARIIDLTNTLTPNNAISINTSFPRTKSPNSNYSQMFKMKGKSNQPPMTPMTSISLRKSPNNLLNSPVVSNYFSLNGLKSNSPDRKTLHTFSEKDRNSVVISTPNSVKYKDYFKSGSLKSANINGKKIGSGNVTKFTTHNIEKDLIRNIAKGSESEVAEFACCTLSGSNAININLRLKEFCLNNNLILKEVKVIYL
jgi:hypothetical protein